MDRRYQYGHTVVSAPPVVPVDRIERVVNGATLIYLRKAGRVRIFDGHKELMINRETEKQILRVWPQGEQTPDPLSWWD